LYSSGRFTVIPSDQISEILSEKTGFSPENLPKMPDHILTVPHKNVIIKLSVKSQKNVQKAQFKIKIEIKN
jgi:hypothetical protein